MRTSTQVSNPIMKTFLSKQKKPPHHKVAYIVSKSIFIFENQCCLHNLSKNNPVNSTWPLIFSRLSIFKGILADWLYSKIFKPRNYLCFGLFSGLFLDPWHQYYGLNGITKDPQSSRQLYQRICGLWKQRWYDTT